jgi:hypothetical protein
MIWTHNHSRRIVYKTTNQKPINFIEYIIIIIFRAYFQKLKITT